MGTRDSKKNSAITAINKSSFFIQTNTNITHLIVTERALSIQNKKISNKWQTTTSANMLQIMKERHSSDCLLPKSKNYKYKHGKVTTITLTDFKRESRHEYT